MNVLAIGAHPDDVELGCFGSLLEKKRQGHNVYAVALAPGAYGLHDWPTIERTWQRAREILCAGKGEADYLLGSFPIGQLQQDWNTVGYVDGLIEKFGIDVIITHHHGESHQDHIATERIAASAARRRVDAFWLWESSVYTHRNVFPFQAQRYVPISRASFEGKMQTLQSYLEAGLLEPREVEAHRHLATYRGAELRRDFAEAFEVVWEVSDR